MSNSHASEANRLTLDAAPDFLDVHDQARVFGVSENTIRDWHKTGFLRAELPTKKLIISKRQVVKICERGGDE